MKTRYIPSKQLLCIYLIRSTHYILRIFYLCYLLLYIWTTAFVTCTDMKYMILPVFLVYEWDCSSKQKLCWFESGINIYLVHLRTFEFTSSNVFVFHIRWTSRPTPTDKPTTPITILSTTHAHPRHSSRWSAFISSRQLPVKFKRSGSSIVFYNEETKSWPCCRPRPPPTPPGCVWVADTWWAIIWS